MSDQQRNLTQQIFQFNLIEQQAGQKLQLHVMILINETKYILPNL